MINSIQPFLSTVPDNTNCRFYIALLAGLLLSLSGQLVLMCRKILFLAAHLGLKGRAGPRALVLTLLAFVAMSIMSSTGVLGE